MSRLLFVCALLGAPFATGCGSRDAPSPRRDVATPSSAAPATNAAPVAAATSVATPAASAASAPADSLPVVAPAEAPHALAVHAELRAITVACLDGKHAMRRETARRGYEATVDVQHGRIGTPDPLAGVGQPAGSAPTRLLHLPPNPAACLTAAESATTLRADAPAFVAAAAAHGRSAIDLDRALRLADAAFASHVGAELRFGAHETELDRTVRAAFDLADTTHGALAVQAMPIRLRDDALALAAVRATQPASFEAQLLEVEVAADRLISAVGQGDLAAVTAARARLGAVADAYRAASTSGDSAPAPADPAPAEGSPEAERITRRVVARTMVPLAMARYGGRVEAANGTLDDETRNLYFTALAITDQAF